MSITLKRPMFRKGGEVMEGIMTGIKPRKMFALGTEDQTIVDNVRRKMNLIDVVAGGGSSISDPLTQFLLQTGQNLIGGESAGGTKLQEIVGATKKPLASAIKAQQLKDAQNRKLATTLISKTGAGNFDKAFREYGQYMTNPKTGKAYTKEEFRPVYGATQIYRKGMSPEERSMKEEESRKEVLSKKKNILQQQEYTNVEMQNISNAEKKIFSDGALLKSMGSDNPYVPNDEYEKGQTIEVDEKDGRKTERQVFIPNDPSDFTINRRYFLFNEVSKGDTSSGGIFVVFDGNRLIEDTTVSF